MAEVDTGPGLEAQFSWDYSHSKNMPDALAGHDTELSPKQLHHAEDQHSVPAGIVQHTLETT